MVELLRVFGHVGFFYLRGCTTTATTKDGPRANLKKGRLIMYIGGGLVTLVIIVLVVMFFVRGL